MNKQIDFARVLHIISAVWTLLLAFLVFGDVLGRSLFGAPFPGTKEIIQNSVVTITFVQIPLAIYSGAMLRTPILADALPPFYRRLLRTFGALLGCGLFLALLWGTWPSFWDAYRVGEYEGEGSLRVPTWPVRGAIGFMSAFGVLAYFWMIVLDWRDELIGEIEAPGAMRTFED